MRNRYRIILLLLVLVFAASLSLVACGKDEKKATITNVNVRQAYDGYFNQDGAVIVDVRQPEEWATTGTAPDAILIPLGEVQQRAPGELSKDDKIYVICNSGNRSQQASQILLDLGYKKVYNVEGGIQAWLSANLPTVVYTP
ncbi:MAG: rhodanese-like domain-containing protein [Anaerolineae bacterium]|nr:rhodanese-like domain-containing protein [Anaerolineae bacterium]